MEIRSESVGRKWMSTDTDGLQSANELIRNVKICSARAAVQQQLNERKKPDVSSTPMAILQNIAICTAESAPETSDVGETR